MKHLIVLSCIKIIWSQTVPHALHKTWKNDLWSRFHSLAVARMPYSGRYKSRLNIETSSYLKGERMPIGHWFYWLTRSPSDWLASCFQLSSPWPKSLYFITRVALSDWLASFALYGGWQPVGWPTHDLAVWTYAYGSTTYQSRSGFMRPLIINSASGFIDAFRTRIESLQIV